MSGDGIAKGLDDVVRNVVFVVVAAFGLFVLFVWCAMLLSYTGFTTWPTKPSTGGLLTVFAMSLATLLAVLWVSASIKVVLLDESAKKTVGRLLIGAVLASVATAIASAIGGKL